MTIIYKKNNNTIDQILFPDTVEDTSSIESYTAYEDSLKQNVDIDFDTTSPFKIAEGSGLYTTTMETSSIDNAFYRDTESSAVFPKQIIKDSADDNLAYVTYLLGTDIHVDQINTLNKSVVDSLSYSGDRPTGNMIVQNTDFIYIIYNTTTGAITEAKITKIDKSDFTDSTVIMNANTTDKFSSIRIIEDILYIGGNRTTATESHGALHVIDLAAGFSIADSFYGTEDGAEYFDITVTTNTSHFNDNYYVVNVAIEGASTYIGSIQIDASTPTTLPADGTIIKTAIDDEIGGTPGRMESNSDEYSFLIEGGHLHRLEHRVVSKTNTINNGPDWIFSEEYNLGLGDFEINYTLSYDSVAQPVANIFNIISSAGIQAKLYYRSDNKIEFLVDGVQVFITDSAFALDAYNFYNITIQRVNDVWKLYINDTENEVPTSALYYIQEIKIREIETARPIHYDYNFHIKDLETGLYVMHATFKNINNPLELEVSFGDAITTFGDVTSKLSTKYNDKVDCEGSSDLSIANILGTNIIYVCGADTNGDLLIQTYSELLVNGEDISIGYDGTADVLVNYSIFVDADNSIVYHYGKRGTTEHFAYKTDLVGSLETNAIDFNVKFSPTATGAFASVIEEAGGVQEISLVGIGLTELADDVIDTAVIKHGEGFKDYYQKGDTPADINTYYYVGVGGDYIYNKETGGVETSTGTGAYNLAVRSFYPQQSTTIYEAFLETANIYLDPSFRNNEMAKDNVLKAYITTAMSMANMKISWSYDGNYAFHVGEKSYSAKEKYVPMRRNNDDYKETGDFDNTFVRLDGSRQLCIKEVRPNSRNGHSFKLRVEAVMANNDDVEALDEFKIVNINFTPAGAIYVEGD